MATKSISQLDTQATANETDLFEVAIVDQNSASGYASKKESAAVIADAIVGEYQYPLRITGTTTKTIAGAINELKKLVDLLPQFAIEVVQTLPVSDISETTIYLVPTQDPEQGNYYEEYIYVNNAWELVGTTAVDLSGYYTSAQVDTLLAAKANTSSLAKVATSGAYSDLSGKPTIDTALDTTSTNAVENRAVAGAIEEIESEISSPDTSDNEPYLLRDSASGTADRMVDELVGGTVAWNQLIRNGNFSQNTSWYPYDSTKTSLTIADEIAKLTVLTSGGGGYSYGLAQQNIASTIKGHLYFIAVSIKLSSKTVNMALDFEGSLKPISKYPNSSQPSLANNWYRYYLCEKANSGNYRRIIIEPPLVPIDSGETLEFKNVQYIDLTQLLGTAIANYISALSFENRIAFVKKIITEDYYAYNAGELMSVKATAHVMRDANDNIIGNYPLDANLELRGLFQLDANNNLYCDGDTYESSGKVTRKYGFLDLGSLTYTNSSVPVGEIPVRYYSNEIANIKPPVDNNTVANILCPIYKTVAINNMDSQSENMLIGVSSIKRIYVRNTNYADKDSFKTAMSGVYLIYELETPTTETAASFAGIQVVDGDGTEEYIDSRAVPIPVGHNTTYIHGSNEYRTAVESYLASLDARITALEGGSSNRSLSLSPVLTKSLTSNSDKTEGKAEETEEETKEEAQKNDEIESKR